MQKIMLAFALVAGLGFGVAQLSAGEKAEGGKACCKDHGKPEAKECCKKENAACCPKKDGAATQPAEKQD